MLGFSAVSLPRVQLHKNFVCLPKDNVQSSSCRYIQQIKYKYFLSFVDRASRYNRVNKNQLNAHLILSILRQPLHVAGVSRPIFRRYNRMYTIVGTYYSIQMTVCCPVGLQSNCCVHTVLPPDDGLRYARNMQRLTKYTQNKLYIKLVFCTQCTNIYVHKHFAKK